MYYCYAYQTGRAQKRVDVARQRAELEEIKKKYGVGSDEDEEEGEGGGG